MNCPHCKVAMEPLGQVPVRVGGTSGGWHLLFGEWADATEGVWVELPYPASPDDAGVPRIQRGTTTLIAGTKSVTGNILTSTSRIFLQMKDPGAGAITGFASLDAPAADRNTGTGAFVINAIDDAKATIATAVCTVEYLIIG